MFKRLLLILALAATTPFVAHAQQEQKKPNYRYPPPMAAFGMEIGPSWGNEIAHSSWRIHGRVMNFLRVGPCSGQAGGFITIYNINIINSLFNGPDPKHDNSHAPFVIAQHHHGLGISCDHKYGSIGASHVRWGNRVISNFTGQINNGGYFVNDPVEFNFNLGRILGFSPDTTYPAAMGIYRPRNIEMSLKAQHAFFYPSRQTTGMITTRFVHQTQLKKQGLEVELEAKRTTKGNDQQPYNSFWTFRTSVYKRLGGIGIADWGIKLFGGTESFIDPTRDPTDQPVDLNTYQSPTPINVRRMNYGALITIQLPGKRSHHK